MWAFLRIKLNLNASLGDGLILILPKVNGTNWKKWWIYWNRLLVIKPLKDRLTVCLFWFILIWTWDATSNSSKQLKKSQECFLLILVDSMGIIPISDTAGFCWEDFFIYRDCYQWGNRHTRNLQRSVHEVEWKKSSKICNCKVHSDWTIWLPVYQCTPHLWG